MPYLLRRGSHRGSLTHIWTTCGNIAGERAFLNWVRALKEGQPFALAMADVMAYRNVVHMEYPLEKSFDFSRAAKPEGEDKVVVEGHAARLPENKGYKIAFSALGRPPSYSGKTSLTIRPE